VSRLQPFVARLVAPSRARVADLARAVLERREQAMGEMRGDLSALRACFPEARTRLDTAAALLAPIDRHMTVHAAHARHPRAHELFAARGLPGCPDCAVGADETLGEAAFGEGFDLDELLEALSVLDRTP
jgi:hypothetical protein